MSNPHNMISVIILNYLTFDKTIELVKSLQQQTAISLIKILIVDNASPNDSFAKLKRLEREYNNVTVITTEENLGYARGNNFGLEFIEKYNPTEYIAIANNDIVLEKNCFELLISKHEELDNPGIIAPIMVNEKGERQPSGNLGSTWDDFKSLFSLYNILNKNKQKVVEIDTTGKKAMQVEVVWGSFMFTKLEKFKKMGFFSPETFLFVEERFVAESAKRHGYKNYLILDLTYLHEHSSPTISSVHSQVSKYRLLYKSRLTYIRKHKKNGWVKALLMKPFMAYSILEWSVITIVKKIKLK